MDCQIFYKLYSVNGDFGLRERIKQL